MSFEAACRVSSASLDSSARPVSNVTRNSCTETRAKRFAKALLTRASTASPWAAAPSARCRASVPIFVASVPMRVASFAVVRTAARSVVSLSTRAFSAASPASSLAILAFASVSASSSCCWEAHPRGARATAIQMNRRSVGRARVVDVGRIDAPLVGWPLLDAQADAFRRQLEVEPFGGREEVDHDAVLVPHDGRAGAGRQCALDAAGHIRPVEVIERLHVEDLGGGPRPNDTQGEEGEAIDLDGETLTLVGQGAVTPRVTEDERHRGLRDLQDGVGGCLGP